MSHTKPSWVALVSLTFACSAFAQEPLRLHHPHCGLSGASLSDLDGDRVPDYGVARRAPWTDEEDVKIFSGRNGALLRTIQDSAAKLTGFGSALADVGDVDGDGVSDLLIGAHMARDPSQPFVEPGAGFVYSGSDGSRLLSVFGSADHDWLGISVAVLGDVTGDGRPDFVLGADKSLGFGYARGCSGADGSTLYELKGSGYVAALSDHDHDGCRDFVVIGVTNATVHSGATGVVLATIPTALTTFFGAACEVDDFDGDGEPELALGELETFTTITYQVRVVSIPTQTTLRTHVGPYDSEFFGGKIAAVIDADGDGIRDYLVGAAGYVGGSASLFSGRTGEQLYRFVDALASGLTGFAVAGLGDLDGDGFGDLLVGSPYHLEPGRRGAGAVLLFRGNDLWLNAHPKSATANATATLSTHGAPAGNPAALFLVDVSGAPTFSLIAVGFADPVEAFVVQDTVPPGLAGVELTFRSYAIGRTGRLIASADERIAFE